MFLSLFWTVWKTKNKSCFQSVKPKDPTRVILHLSHYLNECFVTEKRSTKSFATGQRSIVEAMAVDLTSCGSNTSEKKKYAGHGTWITHPLLSGC